MPSDKYDLTAADLFEVDTTQPSGDSNEFGIDLVRPSGKDQHSAQEWRDYIYELEKAEDARMMRMVRDMSQMTLRETSEALMGPQLTERLFGAGGGQIRLTEIKLGDKNVMKLLEAEVVKQVASQPVRAIPDAGADAPIRIVEERIVADDPMALLVALVEKLDGAGFKSLVEKLEPDVVKKLVDRLSPDTLRRLLTT
jgi:hypothetical protein